MTEIERYAELNLNISRKLRGNWLYARTRNGKRFLLPFFLLSYFFLLALQMEIALTLHLFPAAILFLGIIMLGISLVCVKAIFPLLYRLRNYFVLIALACFLSFFTGGRFMRLQAIRAQHRSEKIVEALGQYYKAHREYPKSLTGLVPEYVESVPNSGMGVFPHPFRFENFHPVPVYRLSFDFHGGEYDFYYLSVFRKWTTRYPYSGW